MKMGTPRNAYMSHQSHHGSWNPYRPPISMAKGPYPYRPLQGPSPSILSQLHTAILGSSYPKYGKMAQKFPSAAGPFGLVYQEQNPLQSWQQLPSRRSCLLLPRHLAVQQSSPPRLPHGGLHKSSREDKIALPSIRHLFRAVTTKTRTLDLNCQQDSRAVASRTKNTMRLRRSPH